MLRCYTSEHQRDWDEYIFALAYAYNQSVHRITGCATFDLVLTRQPPDPTVALDSERDKDKRWADREDYVGRMVAAMEGARTKMKAAQTRYKKDYDRRIKRGNAEIKAGDYVYLNPEGTTKMKLGGHALGPFFVLDRTERTFVIQRGELVERVNSDRVTRAPAPYGDTTRTAEVEGGTELQNATPQDMRDKNTSGRSWLVKRLLAHRVHTDGTTEFKVEWDGPYEDTWDPRANIPEELVSRYLRRRRSDDRKKKGAEAREESAD